MAITFNLKRPNGSNPSSIYARYIYSGYEVKYYLKDSVPPRFWDSKNHRVKRSRDFPGYLEINALLNNLTTQMESIYRNLRNELNGRIPAPLELKKAFDLKLGIGPKVNLKDPSNTLCGYLEHFIELSKKGMRHEKISEKTIFVYRRCLAHLKQFEKATNETLTFAEIDQDFYSSFLGYLRNEKQLSVNTIGKQIKVIKTVMRHALDAKKHSNTDFQARGFKILREDGDSIYLNEMELSLIEKLDLSMSPTLDRVRDAFLIGCKTGLRYSDYSELKIHNINNGFIEIEQKKTEGKVTIPIHPSVERILSKYGWAPPPVISNQRSNTYLKELCKLIPELNEDVEIKQQVNGLRTLVKLPKYKLITTHTARRSFATNEFLAGTQSITIMAITGHKSEKVFLNYIKVKSEGHARILKENWEKRNIAT